MQEGTGGGLGTTGTAAAPVIGECTWEGALIVELPGLVVVGVDGTGFGFEESLN